jgi:hypothetical protein
LLKSYLLPFSHPKISTLIFKFLTKFPDDSFALLFLIEFYLYSRREHEVKTFARTGDRKGSPLQAVGEKAAFAGANTFSPQVTDGSIARNIIHTFFS